MEINFVPMRREHLKGVLEIENSSFPTPWSEQAFAHEITGNDFAHYIVALADKKIAGYAGMWIILDEGHVTTIAVHPLQRRKAVGRRLLNELVAEAKRRGCTKMTLEVRPSNEAAIDLYQRTGFVSYGVRPGYYTDTGEDAIIMWKHF